MAKMRARSLREAFVPLTRGLESPRPWLGLTPLSTATVDLTSRICRILKDHAHLDTPVEGLSPSSDLYQAGMTSHASVNVMLALEGEFDIEFPDHLLKRSVFESIASIRSAIDELTACR